MKRLHVLLCLLAFLAAAAVLAACGGDDNGGTSLDESTDAKTVLDQAFADDNKIDSGVIDLRFSFDVTRGEDSSKFNAVVSGPIDASGDGLPVFDFTGRVKADSPRRDFDVTAGAISTGDGAFVNYKGTDYEVDPQTYELLTQAFDAGNQQNSNSESDTPQGLPAIRDFLTNVKNEGTEDVEGTETVHVSGAVDVDGLIDRIRPLAAGASALGIGPANIPTPQELDGLAQLVKSASFDVWAGADDNILRRFTAVVDLDQPGGAGTAQLKVGLTLAEVNEPQEVSAPEEAQPLSQLLNELGLDGLGFGSLGGLGGSSGIPSLPGGSDSGTGGSGGSSGGSDSGGAGGDTLPGGITPTLPQGVPAPPSPDDAQAYIDCLEKVVTAEDLQRCQEILR